MFRFKFIASTLRDRVWIISIHHMFRFKKYGISFLISFLAISIHHMFRFKTLCINKNKKEKIISIHHMFRFKPIKAGTINFLKSFQYIICFGSSLKNTKLKTEGLKFQYIICFGSSKNFLFTLTNYINISIHHMFRFKI